MRILDAVFIVAIFFASSVACAPQSPTSAAPLTPSGLLQPSLDKVLQTAAALNLEKWKKGTVRDEAREHIDAIRRDLQSTLPPLLEVADAAPGTISKMLPIVRNVDALYDVLLRVVEASRVSAPSEQITQLAQALIGLENARLALYDRLQGSADAVEKQVGDLQSSLRARAAVACPAAPAPVTPACVTAAPIQKAKKKRQPPAKPPQTPPSSTTTTAQPGK